MGVLSDSSEERRSNDDSIEYQSGKYQSGRLQLPGAAASGAARVAILRSGAGAEWFAHDAVFNALAAEMVMDRTTLGRNILPLQRDKLIAVVPGESDRRSKELRLTEAGVARLRAALKGWQGAQQQFESTFGVARAKALRTLLHDVTSHELEAAGR
jgi:DNA-binding MarR family transcriptional regulator